MLQFSTLQWGSHQKSESLIFIYVPYSVLYLQPFPNSLHSTDKKLLLVSQTLAIKDHRFNNFPRFVST